MLAFIDYCCQRHGKMPWLYLINAKISLYKMIEAAPQNARTALLRRFQDKIKPPIDKTIFINWW